MIPVKNEMVRLGSSRQMPQNRSTVARLISQSRFLRKQLLKESFSTPRNIEDFDPSRNKIRLRLMPVQRRKSQQKNVSRRGSEWSRCEKEVKQIVKQQDEQIGVEQQFYRQVKILQEFKYLSKYVN